MAKAKKIQEQDEVLTQDRLIEMYMNDVLENGEEPGTVYKFCKQHDITETEFYNFFGSFEGLKMGIWKRFFEHTLEVMQSSKEYASFDNREKMLTLYYTFFEMLTANRSYVLFTLRKEEPMLKNAGQLKGLRREVKHYTAELIREGNQEKQGKLLKRSETIFSEAAWVQLMFLLKFWMDDNSPQFESTDVAIEKSVNTVFDLFENSPLERVLDLGKFLWKEKMA
ncbi:TetR/AcrR family transcriptional regulator [Salinimicrobium sediminilitoris]|uniref:TetR/AcrR family transcriptional regulator n=1 Tax=Salinimicrobium sediminilitoris TaxID=2876715 RepID=UPI001E3ED2DF|nr:TetR family transcriptional regulator C-terminal domain-containing protein [Salinimicrobium sediminilitoris]MCC8360528.1 TetR/AcrR family transcriptional regulator [Salinimicrobium sediminilitoris]